MREGEVEVALLDYLDAAEGDPKEALRLAIEDLFSAQDEAQLTAKALDDWVSRGYVQGRATAVLRRITGGSGGATR